MKQQMKEQEKEEARRVQAKILYCWTVYCREKESRHNVFRSFIRITTNKIIYNLIDKDELQRYEYWTKKLWKRVVIEIPFQIMPNTEWVQ